jgi:hypothetical protein
MSRVERLSIFIGLISCAAALAVVPEIRCSVGLSAPECPAPRSRAGDAQTPESAVIGRIRRDFNEIERLAADQDAWRTDLSLAGTDSAYATFYPVRGDIRKVRVRSFREDRARMSQLFYYTGRKLIFVHEVHSVAENGDWRQTREQRFYFDEGKPVAGPAASGALGLMRDDGGAAARARIGEMLIRSTTAPPHLR